MDDGSSAGLRWRCLLGASPLRAQRQPQQRPLGPQPDVELRVAPFFDGFYTNPDGTITFSFGYSNLNRDGDCRDPARPGQRHPAEGIRRPAADVLSARRARTRPMMAAEAAAASRPPRSPSGGVHRDRARRLQRRRRLDAAPPRAELQRSGAREEQRLLTPLADGDGIDAAAPAIQGRRPGRPRAVGHRRRSAAGLGRRAAAGQHLDRGRQQAREGADRGQGAGRQSQGGPECDLVQAFRTRPDHFHASQAANRGAPGNRDDVGDLQAAGRVRDPRARR